MTLEERLRDAAKALAKEKPRRSAGALYLDELLLQTAEKMDERARIFADLALSVANAEENAKRVAAVKVAKSVRREMILRLESLYRLRKFYATAGLPKVCRELQRIRRRLRKAEDEIEPFGYRLTARRGGWNPHWRASESPLRKWIDRVEGGESK